MKGLTNLSYAAVKVATKNHKTAFRDYLRYYTHSLKVGIPIAITGGNHLKSGVGKSYTAMRMAEIMDRDFREGTAGIDKIVFEPEEYVEAMQKLENKRGIKGQTIIIDEAGILVNAKKWFSYFNQAMTDTVVTFRELRGLAIFVTPAIKSLDRDVRIYTTHTGVCYKHFSEGSKQFVLMKWFRNSWDEWRGKPYRKRIQMFFQDAGQVGRIDRFRIQFPKNKELVEEYEKRMKKYKSQIRNKILLYSFKEKTNQELADQILKEKEAITKHSKTGKDHAFSEDIADLYGITYRRSRVISRLVNQELRKNG